MSEPIKIVVTAETAQAADALMKFVQQTGSGMHSLVPAAAAAGGELKTLRETAMATHEGFRTMESGVMLLAGTRFPELSMGVMGVTEAMRGLRSVALLTGASLTTVALPLVALAAALAPAGYAWMEMDKAQKLAADSQKRLIDQTTELLGLMKKLADEAFKVGATDEQENSIIQGLIARGKLAEAQGLMHQLGVTRPAVAGLEDYTKLGNEMDRESGNEFDNSRVKAHQEYLEKIKRLDADYKSGALEIPYKQANAESGMNGPEVDPKAAAAAEYQKRQAQAQTILDNTLAQTNTKQDAELDKLFEQYLNENQTEAAQEGKEKVEAIENQITDMESQEGVKRGQFAQQEYQKRVEAAQFAYQQGTFSEEEYTRAVAEAQQKRKAGEQEYNAELEKDAQLKQEISRLDEEAKLHAIQNNPRLTNTEKAQQQIPLYTNEWHAVDAGITAQQGIINSTPEGSTENLQAMKDKNQLLVQQTDLENKLKQLETSGTWQGAFQQNLTQLQNNFGNVAVSLTNGAFSMIQRGVQGISSAITGLIMGTETAGQAFAQFGISMLESFISMITNALIYAYVAIPILTALGVLTGGGMASAGSVATVAAVTAGISGVGAAMCSTGGLITGPGTGTSDSIPAFLSNGEFVVPAEAVNRIGVDNLEVMRTGASSGGSAAGVASAAGGRTAGITPAADSSKNNISMYSFTDMRQMADHLEKNPDHEKWVLDVVRNNVHKFR